MYVKKLKDHQIADIMRVISDPDAEVRRTDRPGTFERSFFFQTVGG